MKKISLVLSLLCLTFLAQSCMVVSETAIFKASDKVVMPDISGAFTDPKHGTFVLSRQEGFTNSFSLASPDKQTMTLVFEPLPTEGRYVVQVANPAGPEVLLGLCVIANQELDIYGFISPDALKPLAKKHGLEINEKGIITKKPSDKKLLAFFDASFDSKYSSKITSIRPGHSKGEAAPAAEEVADKPTATKKK